MVYIHKPAPNQRITDALHSEKDKANGDYKIPVVMEKIKNNFHNKCYLCESKEPTNINIEHFTPHRGDNDLKFDWDNLFWSCAHCNNIKRADYNTNSNNSILNCTDENDRVEESIQSLADSFPGSDVSFLPDGNNPKIQITINLLTDIFNGTTEQKRLEAINLRKALTDELFKFNKLLHKYTEANLEQIKNETKADIENELSIKSAFASFKRWKIRQKSYLLDEFGQYL